MDKQSKDTQVINKRGVAEILTCYLMWGILPVFWKFLAEVNPVYVLASRILWSAVLCLLIILLTGKMSELREVLANRQMVRRLVASGIAVAINWGLYIYAINSNHILDASLAYYLNPLLSIALGFVIFKERLLKLQWVSIIIAATGILIAIIMYGEVPIFALTIAISFSVYGALKKGFTCSGLVSTCVEASVLVPIALIYVVFSEISGAGAIGVLEGAEFILLPMAGVVTTIPLLVFSAGITKIPMSLSGILMYINPTIQLLIGVLLYGERFDQARKVMFVCVWIAVFLFISAGRKKA